MLSVRIQGTGSPREADDEPLAFALNWRRSLEGKHLLALEFPLYSDAFFTGDDERHGPYLFLNLVTQNDAAGTVRPRLVLRYFDHVGSNPAKWPRTTNTDRYHGGWLLNEVTALASLSLGVRLYGGAANRMLDANGDPAGKPIAWDNTPGPSHLRLSGRRPIVPWAMGSRPLGLLQQLDGVERLDLRQSIAVVRAARLFSDGLWLCEQEPHLTWLMLVSALEVGAVCWTQDKGNAVDRLRDAKAELSVRLEEAGGPALLQKVAEAFADSLGATKKFRDFCEAFLPDPPTERPEGKLAIDWSVVFWRKALGQIYGYRSGALHAGIPFPAPMSDPPLPMSEGQPPSEVGIAALAQYADGGSWLAKDLPINLNVFAQFTQGVLLKWLAHLIRANDPVGATDGENLPANNSGNT